MNLNEKKYAVVTGSASGIGREIAYQLHMAGFIVFGLDIGSVQTEYMSFICDVSDENQVEKVFEKINEQTTKIDYLVNAAGMLSIGQPLSIKDISIKQWDAIMRINLKSAVIMIKYVYPFMRNANDASIVNISSEQSINPDEYFAPYAVSKAGINMLTISAAKEFLNNGIRVNAIALGTVKTNFLKGLSVSNEQAQGMFDRKDQEIPFGVMDTVSVYNVVKFLLSEESKFITGEILRCDGGRFLGKK